MKNFWRNYGRASFWWMTYYNLRGDIVNRNRYHRKWLCGF